MQTPHPERTSATTFFSRERRRQRMLKFLEAFERRSWSNDPEQSFIFPLSREDLRETGMVPSNDTHR